METWAQIINSALLGTEKRAFKKEILSGDLLEAYENISVVSENNEEVFLQTAALAYNYRQCGFVPFHKDGITVSIAKKEVKDYAGVLPHRLLNDIIETSSIPLLQFWLKQCEAANWIVQPEFIPVLLDIASRNKIVRDPVSDCCGNRGAWLSQFNRDWQFAEETDIEQLWEIGTLEQRKTVLAELRKSDVSKARELLQQAWPQENAASKTELVKQLSVNAGDEDLPWLESLLNEKSQKVKDEVYQVLKVIPNSTLVRTYWEILQQSIKLVQSRGMLGIGYKTGLEIQLTRFDESVFKTGIQQLSGQANITDEHFILYQLISQVPPHFWETHFNMESTKVLELFYKEESTRSYVPALGMAASRFKDHGWIRNIIKMNTNHMFLDVFKLLPQQEAESYALQFLKTDEGAASILHIIDHFPDEWGIEFSRSVLKFTSKNPYQYNKSFYNRIAHLLHHSVIPELEQYTPKEEHFKNMWESTSNYLARLMDLKWQTQKSFNE